MAQVSVQREAGRANRGARRVISHPASKLLVRAGYVARGLLYGVMGYEALQIAQTGAGRRADQQSGLLAIAGFPFGRTILIAGIISIGAYAIWGFVRAIYDPLHRGHDAVGILTRLGFAWSGLAYTALMFFALALLLQGTGGGADGTQKLTQSLLSAPAGVLLAYAAGLIGIAAGIGQFIDAWRAPFKKDEKRGEMSQMERRTTDALGRFGFFSRGVVFVLMGWFIFVAAQQNNAGQAKGFSEAFGYLLTQPFGRLLLALVAVGFVALGLHSIVLARYIRLPEDDG